MDEEVRLPLKMQDWEVLASEPVPKLDDDSLNAPFDAYPLIPSTPSENEFEWMSKVRSAIPEGKSVKEAWDLVPKWGDCKHVFDVNDRCKKCGSRDWSAVAKYHFQQWHEAAIHVDPAASNTDQTVIWCLDKDTGKVEIVSADRFKLADVIALATARAAELREKSAASNLFEPERVKYLFAAKEMDKLVEEMKAL